MSGSPPPSIPDSHWRRIVDSAVDFAIVSCDGAGLVTTWNSGAERILGWSAAEMVGRPMDDFFTPEDVEAGGPQRERAQALAQGRAEDERWHVRKGGERFWASGELMPLRDEAGAAVGFIKILRDRTGERLDAAQLQGLNRTLRASEERLQMALEAGGMGAWQADVRTGTATWCPGMDRVHGLPPGTPALSAAEYCRLIHPGDRERVIRTLEESVRSRSEHLLEYRVIWPDGSVHWLEARGKLIPDGQDEPTTLAGVCVDITPRKAMEADLLFLASASAELAALSDYQTTLDKVARLAVPGFSDWCAVDMLQPDGTLQRVATAHVDPAKIEFARQLGRRFSFSREASVGTWNVIRTGRAELVAEVTDAVLEAAVQEPEHRQALRALGFHSYMAAPLKSHGETFGVISFVSAESRRGYKPHDLRMAEDLGRRAAVALDNARLVQALRDSDRAKDVFLATLAHELRNPLAPISNGVTILKRAPGDRAKVDQVSSMIDRQVTQLIRLVDDLLDISRISTGKIELQIRPSNLVQILTSAVETSRPHIESARHKLTLTFPEASTALEADPARLAQVFANLLNNAAKYTPPGGEISVQVEAQDEQLTVRVRDSGTGIDPDMLSQVFGLFTQVTHPVERRQGGLGIGLSLVKGLVHLHGGTVEAHSEGLERGSEFVVCLPRRAGQGGLQGPESAGGPGVRPSTPPTLQVVRRVLVVDDNLDAANMVAELLRMFGNEVAVAVDGMSAVAMTAEMRPDVVLLDIGLPDVDGYEVARRIRKLEKVRQPLLIALTGWGQKQDVEMAVEAGFDQHWTKPVDPDKLQELSSR